ncbi:hypothetical protein Godav_006562 [Gossypium davidsonii]|uniref:Uncharacterized protein n=1 Tax=Gossypium davidsonii TaxID=34287 RepID=A0A7J8S4N0_GOSDV|nr:hypothetical protein [Gossypium davidsonii]
MDMLFALEGRVINLDESMGDMSETLEVVEGCIAELDTMEEKIKEVVLESLGSNMEEMLGVLNSTTDKPTMRDNALEVIVIALKEETMAMTRGLSTRIEEL